MSICPKSTAKPRGGNLTGSKTALEGISGAGRDDPGLSLRGKSIRAIETLAREAGYEAAFATDRAPRDHAENLYRLRRAVVFPRNTVWEILIKAQRWYPAYQDWKRR